MLYALHKFIAVVSTAYLIHKLISVCNVNGYPKLHASLVEMSYVIKMKRRKTCPVHLIKFGNSRSMNKILNFFLERNTQCSVSNKELM